MPSTAEFRVVAVVAAFNEADVIGQVLGDLIEQGIDVYLMDDGSTDGTVAAAEPYLGRGLLAIERLADTLPGREPDRFDWARILERKAQLARTLDANWVIHHDADEFRESPWANLTVREAIRRVDALGYNAIDFASFDFWPVDSTFRPGDDVRKALPFYSPAAAHDRLQIRCWKNDATVDLASSGGHEARFEGRRVFPLRFIARHYPIRGQAHGERKVRLERGPRFRPDELVRGWHVQYDGLTARSSFVRPASTLVRYDAADARVAVTMRSRDAEASEAELQRLQSEVAAARAELERLRASVEARVRELSAQLSDARAAQSGLADDAARLRSALVARQDEAADLAAALDHATRRVDALERSWSWRWTAPARAAYRLIKGGT